LLFNLLLVKVNSLIHILPYFLTTCLVIFLPSNLRIENVQFHKNDSSEVDWLLKNSIPVRSIDPDDNDFTDLMPLINSIGDARIVMLGEATHGDGATFYAKQRLIKFLHEVMGFDVLAWEALFFSMEELNRKFEFDQPLERETGLMKSIYNYTRSSLNTDHPLRHTGFDIVFGSPRAKGIEQYKARLYNLLKTEDSGLYSSSDYQTIADFLHTLQNDDYIPLADERVSLQAAIRRVQDHLLEKGDRIHDSREFKYLARTLENLAAYEQHLVLSTSMGLIPPNIIFRGRKMSENLSWLASDWYPDKKIIVWAGNRHIARNVANIELLRPDDGSLLFKLPPNYREMGDFIHDEFGDSVYCIGFLTYQGSRGHSGEEPENIVTLSGSIESYWHQTGQTYGFLDLRSSPQDHWLRKPAIAHLDGIGERTNWSNVVDGFFYIDTMFPDRE
jgi:erythromycin esterase